MNISKIYISGTARGQAGKNIGVYRYYLVIILYMYVVLYYYGIDTFDPRFHVTVRQLYALRVKQSLTNWQQDASSGKL